MPMKLNNTHTVRPRVAGTAMRAVGGNWMKGMTSKRLANRMKKNMVVRNGAQYIPDSPMVCMMMPSQMNSTPASAMFCTPVGTSARLRPASRNSPSVKMADSTKSSAALLKPGSQKLFQTTSSPMGGNLRAASTRSTPLLWLDPRKRQGSAHVPGLPQQQAEVGHD